MRVWVWTVVWRGADFHLQGRWLVISFALMAAWRGQGIPVIPPLSVHLLLASYTNLSNLSAPVCLASLPTTSLLQEITRFFSLSTPPSFIQTTCLAFSFTSGLPHFMNALIVFFFANFLLCFLHKLLTQNASYTHSTLFQLPSSLSLPLPPSHSLSHPAHSTV